MPCGPIRVCSHQVSAHGQAETHHVYLIPGLFGFAELAGYDYFEHLERVLAERFGAAGAPLALHIVPAPPTASISMRAVEIARTIARDAGGHEGPIHLLGHSTGGLDGRLLLSPAVRLPLNRGELGWTLRVRTLVSVNAPHHGTPLAGYFATVSGTRVLYALSLFTVMSLTFGRLPLSLFSRLLAAISGFDRQLGLDIGLLEEVTGQVLRFVDERGRQEIKDYLEHVRHDQGGIIQLMPEVMELFNSAVGDNPAVRYGCVATAAPAPSPRRVIAAALSPMAALQLAIYTGVYGVASRASSRYPYALPDAAQALMLTRGLGRIGTDLVDGIVPTLSMLWGELLWCGHADHLDVVGHFADDGAVPRRHVDWLSSGARFRRDDFAAMTDAICRFMIGP
jgi:triacylglycerol lipase